ncbi:GNAT family N-acetyltransferase [Streptomyces sp. NPDC046939]|uniref:GNAT family N-acetyltransferase n=1 Tax=Streptomyces sp. NPDC046939 TaxID=3155376 RepID=UPI0033C759F0
MPPADASTDADAEANIRADADIAPAPGARPSAPLGESTDPSTDPDCQDTLDLRLSDDVLALIAEQDAQDSQGSHDGHTGDSGHGAQGRRDGRNELHSADAQGGPGEQEEWHGRLGQDSAVSGRWSIPVFSGSTQHDLLDRVGEWGPVTTPSGVFQLVPVRIERDLKLISRWMNDPAVAAFWELAGSETVTADHLRPQLDGDGRSVPCLGVLDGTPMSYWEIYRADLDPLARHYPARPHDTGIHLLIGGVANRGRGLGTTLLKAVADLVLDHRPPCGRVIAEPDLRNTPSVSAFMSAGFRFSAEVDLPDKRAALMVRDRALRTIL